MEGQAAEHIPAQNTSLTVLDRPFSTERRLLHVRDGATIANLIDECGIRRVAWHRLVVMVGDQQIAREYWHVTRPKPGHQVIVKALPADSETLNLTLQIGATLLIGYYAPNIWVAAAATFASSYAINKLVPLPTQEPFDAYGGKQSFSITGQSNRYAPFSTMPIILGKVRTYPPLASRAFTEIVGDDQYLRILFVVGYKSLEITELKIGETSLDDFDDVEYQIVCGGSTDTDASITLFTESVNEVQANSLLADDSYYTFTTDPGTDEFSVDLTAPQGLLIVKDQGTKDNVSVPYTVEYTDATVSPQVWTSTNTSASPITTPYRISGKTGKVVRQGLRFAFPSRGQYTVRIQRTTSDKDPDSDKPVHNDDVYVTAHRSIVNENPVNHTNAALIALRIRATDQLNSQVDTFNCIASSIFNDYDSTSSPVWSEQETANPASIVRAILQSSANARPVSDDRIDLDALQDFHDYCSGVTTSPETVPLKYNAVIDYRISVWELLQQVCSAGLSRITQINGKWTVVTDKAISTPAQHFTARNSWGFKGQKGYLEVPHAFRVRYPNEDQGYEVDERIVYDDSYNDTNATLFETLDLPGVTDPDQVWALARYHLAVARLRPEIFKFNADYEVLAITQGDLIRVSHPSILVGLGAARITSLTLSGTSPDTVATITLDTAQDCDGVTTYVARIRHADGTATLHTITPNASPIVGTYTTWALTTPASLSDGIAVGDLVMFGESGEESIELIVDSIRPAADMTAEITAVPYNSAIYTANTGTIPAYDSHITTPAGSITPVMSYIQSDEWVMTELDDGSLSPNIVIKFGFGGNREAVKNIEVQYRPRAADAVDWITLPLLSWDARDATLADVEESIEYQIRSRYIMLDGTYGPFTDVVNHTVVGASTLPPDVSTFSVTRTSDGTREFRWSMSVTPPDIAGYRIKYFIGSPSPLPDWDNMTALHTGLLSISPWETNLLAAGTYTAAIVSVDLGGRESANPNYIISTLGDPRISNAVVNENIHQGGYPGTKTNCYVSAGNLVPTGQDSTTSPISGMTWSDVGASPHQWGSWTAWNTYADVSRSPEFTMVYEGTASAPGSPEVNYYDLGAVYTFQPLVSATTVDGTGTIKYYERHKDTLGAAWSAYAEISGTVSARYVQIKLEVMTPPAGGVNSYQIILSADTTVEYTNDFDMSTDDTASPHVVGDVRIPLTNSYAVINFVKVALQNVGPNHSWELIDKDTTNGPRIKVYDNAASPMLTDATIDVEVIGILSS